MTPNPQRSGDRYLVMNEDWNPHIGQLDVLFQTLAWGQALY